MIARARGWFFLALIAALASAHCNGGPPSDGAGQAGAGAGGAPVASPDFLSELESLDDYALLAAPGAEVKYLTTVAGAEPPAPFEAGPCMFQNTGRFSYHLQFLRTFPEFSDMSPARYEDLVLRRASRELWGGRLKLFAATPHPETNIPGVVSYTIYAGTQTSEALSVEDIVEVDQKLKSCAPFARDRLVFTPDGSAQLRQTEPLTDELAAQSVAFVPPALLSSGLDGESYSDGEAYGYLALIDASGSFDAIGPRDVVVCRSAPNDLSLVAGLLTTEPQSVGSHLNLRLREKGVPSAFVADLFENALIADLTGRLVHVVVSGEDVEISPARLEDAQAFWASRTPDVGEPTADLSVRELRAFSALTAEDASAFGSKAANLGELFGVLSEENRVDGFAVPFSAYVEFLRENALEAEIDALLTDPNLLLDAEYERARLRALRQRLRAAPLGSAFLEELQSAVVAAYGEAGLRTRLRFRSSTNAEDLPGLSGAGLYDSSSGCLADDLDGDTLGPSACLSAEQEAYYRAELERRQRELEAHPERTFLIEIIDDLNEELSAEKSAEAAIRRVWSSLWSDRAFDDREYYGLDHRKIFMGIAVHPSFVGEQLESVIFTNLEPENAGSLYRVVSQVGEVGVAQPVDPAATPEIVSFRRGENDEPREVTFVSPSSLAEDGARLWSEVALGELAGALFRVQDHFGAAVYPHLEPLMLDVEADVTRDGRVVLKQARPYTPRL